MPTTYPEIDNKRVHITLVEMAPHVLGPFAPEAARLRQELAGEARRRPASRDVREGGPPLTASLVEHDGKQEFLPADIVVWASGITTHPVLADWGVPLGRGRRIEVDDHLRVQGLDDVYAIGDVAVDPDERALPQLAQPAHPGWQARRQGHRSG